MEQQKVSDDKWICAGLFKTWELDSTQMINETIQQFVLRQLV